jgi:hypothetical protein
MISNCPPDTIGSVASSWAASLNQGNHNMSTMGATSGAGSPCTSGASKLKEQIFIDSH